MVKESTHFKDQPGGPGRRSRVPAERANGRTGLVPEAIAAIAPARVGPNPPVPDAIRMCARRESTGSGDNRNELRPEFERRLRERRSRNGEARPRNEPRFRNEHKKPSIANSRAPARSAVPAPTLRISKGAFAPSPANCSRCM